MSPAASRRLLTAGLFISGAAALIYEVIWFRQLSLVLGHGVHALSALLAAFLGGLALGAHLGGRWVERRGASPRTYAALELGVAVSAALVPLSWRAADAVLAASPPGLLEQPGRLAILQLAVATVALVLPTALMGASLPVATAVLVPRGAPLGPRAAGLYAANSLGGAMGAALVAAALLPRLGASAALLCAGGLNVAAAALGGRARPAAAAIVEPPPPASPRWAAPSRRALLLAYALAGFAALTLEVGWSRLAALALGSSLHGLTLTLVSFILGLALGSAAAPRWPGLWREPGRALFLLHGLVAVWTTYSLGWLGGLPDRVRALLETSASFEVVTTVELALVFSSVALPTLAMGAIFPLVAALAEREGRSPGQAVGTVYAANTGGTIAGVLAAGFLFLPWLGMRATVLLAALLSAAAALFYLRPLRAHLGPALVLVGLCAFGAFRAPAWSLEILTRAPFLLGHQGDDRRLGVIVDHLEGASAVAAVRQLPAGQKLLYVGGVLEASSEAPLHERLAHLPLLVHGQARRVLLVGLGAGNTLAAALAHPLAELRCLELSPEVITLARRHFRGDALDDPRVRLGTADGRLFLRHTQERYDVIISQPSYPWMSGAAALFTQEYFQDIRRHLLPGGVAAVWFAAQSAETAASLLATWAEVFPRSLVYRPGRAFEMVFVVGFRSDEVPPAEMSRAAWAEPGVAQAARAAGIRGVEELWAGLAPLVPDPGARINTDDNAFVELAGFRGMTERRAATESRTLPATR